MSWSGTNTGSRGAEGKNNKERLPTTVLFKGLGGAISSGKGVEQWKEKQGVLLSGGSQKK